MTTQFGHKVYQAYTVELADSSFNSHLLTRPRLENMLDLNPWAGKTIVLNGPAGIGKTTLALQWALQGGRQIQYVSARGTPTNMLLQTTPPWTGGQILAEFINGIIQPSEHAERDALNLLYSLTELVITTETLVVLDDLHLLNFKWSPAQMEAASEVLSRLYQATLIAITRSLTDTVLQFFQQRGPVRVLGANQLYFTTQEIDDLATLAPDGPARLAKARRYGGWGTGVSSALNANRSGESSLDDYVLNEVLYTQRADLQNIMLALADFPKITAPLILDIFEHLGVENGKTSAIFNFLPLLESPDSAPDTPAFMVADGVRDILGRLGTQVGDQGVIRALRRYGINWYIDHMDFASARSLATAANLELAYLQGMMPHCGKLADDEAWEEIWELVVGFPVAQLAQFPQIAFWKMTADSHSGRWHDLFPLRSYIMENWPDSDDPYKAAKVHQIEAWNAWVICDLDTTISRARRCFDTLPESNRLDKMIAAISAENAARVLGDTAEIEYWAMQTGRYHTMRSDRDEWWHVNAGFHRLDHMAMCGDLRGAYSMAERWLQRIPEAFPKSKFRYTLLMFYIALEQGDDALAWENLELTRSLAHGEPTVRELELATAVWLSHTGDYDAARAALNLDLTTMRLRLDHNYHRIHLLASIDEASGNIEFASEILVHWFGDEERWTRYFGEPHHGLMRARLLARQENYNDAVVRAHRVTQEAERRGHYALAVAGLAIEAAAWHELANTEERDAHILRAIKHAGESGITRSFAPFGTDVRELCNAVSQPAQQSTSILRVAPPILTDREKEILHLVARGYSNTEISDELYISISTVKNHLASIFRKLGVNNRRDAIQTAIRIGDVQVPTKL